MHTSAASPSDLSGKRPVAAIACAMKQAMNTLSHLGLWLALAMIFSGPCAARELSLYRVDGNEGNVRLHRMGHSSAVGKHSAFIDDSNQESYVKAAVVHPTEKDATYRSEEAKLQQERRLMFFRNLQLGSISFSTSPTFSFSMSPGAYQIGTTWDVLNSALEADRDQQVDSSRLEAPEVTDLDLLQEMIDIANAYAGFETEEDPEGEAEKEEHEQEYIVDSEFEPPQLRGGAAKTPKKSKGTKLKTPKKMKGEKRKKTKATKSKKDAKVPKAKVAKSKEPAKEGKKKGKQVKVKKASKGATR